MNRKLFFDISLNIEDLLLLEAFQIKYLPTRIPHKALATLLRKFPYVKNFLIFKAPSFGNFVDAVLKANKEVNDEELIKEYCNALLWEIADLIVYNKFPEIYDKKVKFNWRIDEIILKESLIGKVVADVGAGSGVLAFLLASYAETIFAIEPLSSFRTFIRQKAIEINCTNLYAIDGFLDSVPLPDNCFDILFTSNAIGWNIEQELQEIERVVKPNGRAIHIMRINEGIIENRVHEILVSGEWKYKFSKMGDEHGQKLRYVKTIV